MQYGCNPTGMTAILERRKEVLQLAREYNFLILEGSVPTASLSQISHNLSESQTTHTITFITARPHGPRRILLSSWMNPRSAGSCVLTACPKSYLRGFESVSHLVQNRWFRP